MGSCGALPKVADIKLYSVTCVIQSRIPCDHCRKWVVHRLMRLPTWQAPIACDCLCDGSRDGPHRDPSRACKFRLALVLKCLPHPLTRRRTLFAAKCPLSSSSSGIALSTVQPHATEELELSSDPCFSSCRAVSISCVLAASAGHSRSQHSHNVSAS